MPAVVRGRVVTPDRLVADGAVVHDGGTITWVGEPAAAPEGLRDLVAATPAHEGYVLPGLVDLHCHGGGGASFPGATDPDEARTAVAEHRRHGTTTLVASLVTAPPEVLLARTELLAGLADAGEIAGIHLEGPFLAVERRGAHAPAMLRPPDADLTAELLAAARGHLVTMTLAPELPGADAVARTLVASGALPSLGHTAAGAAQVRLAVGEVGRWLATDPAARSPRPTVTHLGNAMDPVHHRRSGPVLELLAAAARGRVVLELIGDGAHLDPDFVRAVVELVGARNVALVTDAMAAAGMGDGTYRLGSLDVTVSDGVARLPGTDSLAGGTAHLIDVVRTTVAGGVGLVDAVHAAATTPAAVLGDETIGALVAGRRADLVLTDGDLHPLKVIRKGEML